MSTHTDTTPRSPASAGLACKECGSDQWAWIPDSLAQRCQCGAVRVQEDDGSWSVGHPSIQEWVRDIAESPNSGISDGTSQHPVGSAPPKPEESQSAS